MLDYLKTYLGIHSAVTIYDKKINDLVEIAMQDLTIAGVSGLQHQKIIFKGERT